MGLPDEWKLWSNVALLYLVSKEPIFKQVLDKFYGGSLDVFTVEQLSVQD